MSMVSKRTSKRTQWAHKSHVLLGNLFQKDITTRGVNPGALGIVIPQILSRGSWGRRGSQGKRGVVDGSWNNIISYNVHEVYSRVVIFEEK